MTITATGDVAVDAGETRTVAERVLIVEDEPAARLGLEQLVKSWGFVAGSADVEKHLSLLQEKKDLIITLS